MLIVLFIMAYFAVGFFVMKLTLGEEEASFSDRVTIILLWPVLAFIAFCIIVVACFIHDVFKNQ